MQKAALLLVLFLSACGMGPSTLAGAAIAASAQNPRSADTELVTAFLKDVGAQQGDGFKHAWLGHEARHQDVYNEIVYTEPGEWPSRVSEYDDEQGSPDEIRSRARRIRDGFVPAVTGTRRAIEQLTGMRPRADVVLGVAIQPSDAITGQFKGRSTIFINASHRNYAQPRMLDLILAHELTHVVQRQRFAASQPPLRPMWLALWQEGGAAFTAHRVFKSESLARALAFSDGELAFAQQTAGAAACEFLENAEGMDAFIAYFRGGVRPGRFPARMGYYLGYRVFQEIQAERGEAAAIGVAPGDFLPVARKVLTQLSERRFAPLRRAGAASAPLDAR